MTRGRPFRTLYRFPGPDGIAAMLRGALVTLAPEPSGRVWLGTTPLSTSRTGARAFGAIAVLDPQPLRPRRVSRGGYLARNVPPLPSDLVWVPPSRVSASVAWARLDGSEEILRDLTGEACRTMEALARYAEELAHLRATGAPGPSVPWCEVPLRTRKATLARLGVRPRWTR